MSGEFARSRAIKALFDISLSNYPRFKDKLTTLEDNGALELIKQASTGGRGSRGKRFYQKKHFNRLYNVVLISGFYSEPSIVLDIVNNAEGRRKKAVMLQELLSGVDRVGTVKLDQVNLTGFLNALRTCDSVDEEHFPNPFIQLPQVTENGAGKCPSVLEMFSPEIVNASKADQIILSYLSGDLKAAKEISETVQPDDQKGCKIQQWIDREYREAKEFSALLKSFLD